MSKLFLVSIAFFFSLFTGSAVASQCLSDGSSVDSRNGFCFVFKLKSDGTNRAKMEFINTNGRSRSHQ